MSDTPFGDRPRRPERADHLKRRDRADEHPDRADERPDRADERLARADERPDHPDERLDRADERLDRADERLDRIINRDRPTGPNDPAGPNGPVGPDDPAGPNHPNGPDRPGTPAPVPTVPPAVLARHRARVLDPLTAVRRPGDRLNPTVYVADRLLVRGLPGGSAGSVVARLQAWSDEQGLGLRWVPDPLHRKAAAALGRERDRWDELFTTAVDLVEVDGAPAPPPDVWPLLQRIRHDFAGEPELVGGLALDHVMSAGATWQGVGGIWGGVGGIWGGVGGIWGGVGDGVAGPYRGAGGYSGRVPVVWSAPDPRTTTRAAKHEPLVAVLDTGIGRHPWFATEGAGFTRWAGPGTHPPTAADGVVTDPFNGLVDPLAGHGTFVAGIIRQRCAHAHLLDVPVMAADGTVAESDVLLALGELLRQHRASAVPVRSGADLERRRLDVVNLSMGYYHETPPGPGTPDDAGAEGAGSGLLVLLRAFAEAGVAVVAAAGNAATTTPFLPAGLSSRITGPPPLVAVGALNPDDRTVAAFSNGGGWVTTHAPGAAVVSTVPVTLSGSYRRGLAVDRDDPLSRGTVDPDDFESGFAIWSGTSFAAPWIAGDIAAAAAAGTAGTAGTAGALPAAAAAVLAERARHLASVRQLGEDRP